MTVEAASQRAKGGLRSLQAGRGLAAIAVAAFHMSVIVPPGRSVLSALSRHGNSGVDFFFVLSGFIILYAHERDFSQPSRVSQYLNKRFIRVYPIYWIYTVVAIAFGLFGLGHISIPSTIPDWITTFSLVRLTGKPMPIVSAWTLFYEIAFYLLFASFIFNRWIGLVVVFLWAVVLTVLNRTTPINDVSGVWTSRLCLNFLLGMIACWAHRRIGWRFAASCIAVGVVGIVLAAVYVDRGLGSYFGSLLAISFTLLIAGFAAIERNGPLWFGPLSALGDASYTIYLAHGHIEPLLMHMLKRITAMMNPDAAFLVGLSLTVALSYGLYLTIEKPLVVWLRGSRRA